MANQNPVPDYPDGTLFEALRVARVPDRLAFAADKEVGEMAGRNVIAEIRAMKTDLNHIRWRDGAARRFDRRLRPLLALHPFSFSAVK